MVNRLVEPATLRQRRAEILVCFGRGGGEFHRPFQLRHGLRRAPKRREGQRILAAGRSQAWY